MPAGHRHRVGRRTVHDDASRSIGEGESGDVEERDLGGREAAQVVAELSELGEAGPERTVTVEASEPLLGRHGGHELGRHLSGGATGADGVQGVRKVHGRVIAPPVVRRAREVKPVAGSARMHW